MLNRYTGVVAVKDEAVNVRDESPADHTFLSAVMVVRPVDPVVF